MEESYFQTYSALLTIKHINDDNNRPLFSATLDQLEKIKKGMSEVMGSVNTSTRIEEIEASVQVP